ncbi:g165 [Yersinia phage phiR1-37]|nr:hypothetical protein phiR1-37_gp165 [Yersinia phage phiR1-37]CCE26189.1 g165 [Yersinia phage phiR1-37]
MYLRYSLIYIAIYSSLKSGHRLTNYDECKCSL